MASGELQAVFRSLRLYHGGCAPKAAMDALYRQFLHPGALVFDVGAHVGDRVSSFRRLGARVVAFEPQPLLHRTLRLIHGRDCDVILVAEGAAAETGRMTMRVNSANPTVSTLSNAFVDDARGQEGWLDQSWDRAITVPVVTLDQMIARHGKPDFIKIDVEGFEDTVLHGLTTAVGALSFEFTTISRPVALNCLDRLAALGDYRFNVALGETQILSFTTWLSSDAMASHLINLPHAANSGDVYARRQSFA
ncbi:MAG: FkbM family methyltransferase [Hyphomicrobium sp.]|nr:FkbM family methyltransferase [Hyphomicrobium sp.]